MNLISYSAPASARLAPWGEISGLGNEKKWTMVTMGFATRNDWRIFVPAGLQKYEWKLMTLFAPKASCPFFIPRRGQKAASDVMTASTAETVGAWSGTTDAGTGQVSDAGTVFWISCSEATSDLYGQPPDTDKAIVQFESDYPSDPEGAVIRLRRQIDIWNAAPTSGISPAQAAAVLLSHLPGASYGRQNLLTGTLMGSVVPRGIVQGALSVPDSVSRPDILRAAAGLLEHYRADAWTALRELVESNRPECRYFVWQIAGCEGVAETTRIEALIRLAKNSDPGTRSELAEALDSGLLTDPGPVWEALGESENLDIPRSEAITHE
jgi:hypothetical protein